MRTTREAYPPGAATAAGRAGTGPGNEEPSDRSLVAAFRDGDSRAFDAIVRRYQHLLRRLAAQHVNNSADAADVVQESFLRAWRGLHRFRGDSALSTWLYRIVVNTAANHRAREARHVSSRVPFVEEIAPSDTATAPSPRTPEEIADDVEFRASAHAAIGALSERLRHTVVLHEHGGLTYEQIATLTEVPIGTVRSRIFRARRQLASELDADAI